MLNIKRIHGWKMAIGLGMLLAVLTGASGCQAYPQHYDSPIPIRLPQ